MNLSTLAAGGFSANAQAAGKASPSGSMDYDAFLRLLIAEMKNQDPTAPKDPSEYVAQFATFANVEQAMHVNSKLDTLISSSALAQADDVIGRTLTSADGEITGKIVSVTIGSDGRLVATLDNDETIVIGPGVKIS
jgi:flagellar basal-body rod modification protein FlgD